MTQTECEILAYGLLCVLSASVSFLADRENRLYTIVCTMVITVFWIGNITLWATNSLDYFIITDSAFVFGNFCLWRWSKMRWIAILSACYVLNVALDIAYLKGLPYPYFSWPSNGLFVIEVLVASHRGWLAVIRNERPQSAYEPR